MARSRAAWRWATGPPSSTIETIVTEQEMFDCFGIHSRAWAASAVPFRRELPGWWRRNWVHREAAILCAEARLSSRVDPIRQELVSGTK